MARTEQLEVELTASGTDDMTEQLREVEAAAAAVNEQLDRLQEAARPPTWRDHRIVTESGDRRCIVETNSLELAREVYFDA